MSQTRSNNKADYPPSSPAACICTRISFLACCVLLFDKSYMPLFHPIYVYLQEWLWCVGPFLRARLYFAKKLHGKEGLKKTVVRVKSILAKHKMEVTSSPWRSLPELTNANGAPCYDGCPAQAWSVGCLIDVIYDMEKLVKDD